MHSYYSDQQQLSRSIIHKMKNKNCKSENIRRLAKWLDLKCIDDMSDKQVRKLVGWRIMR